MPEPDIDMITVISDVAPDGRSYIVTIGAGPDRTFALASDKAITYALTVIDAATRAGHDAAVIAQNVNAAGMDKLLAAGMVADLRKDRAPLDDTTTAPLRFEPIISTKTLKPAIHVWLDEQRIAQWTVADTLGHAGHVLQLRAGVDLDAAYHRYVAQFTDPGRARSAVGDLANHFHPEDQ